MGQGMHIQCVRPSSSPALMHCTRMAASGPSCPGNCLGNFLAASWQQLLGAACTGCAREGGALWRTPGLRCLA